MAGVTVRVTGRDRILDRMRQVFQRSVSAGDDAARETAEAVKIRAQQLVPIDTGRLHDSIRVNRQGPRMYVVGPGDEVEYAGYVEYGTSVSPAQPYMRPALAFAQRHLPRQVASRVQAVL